MNAATPTRLAHRPRGFSLIELLVAMAVAGVLAGVAYPAFSAQIAKARRSDAFVALAAGQLAQERWRAERSRYGDAAEIGLASLSPSGHYALSVSAHGSDGYTLVASARGAQAADAGCRHLRLTASGASVSHGSGPDATTSNAAPANRRCWAS